MTSEPESTNRIPAAPPRSGRLDEEEFRLLMVRYQRGESDAIEELVGGLSPLLWRYFVSPYISRSDIEDLLQDCWVRVHRARHTYNPADPLFPWLFAIARRTRIDAFRRRRRRESRETVMELPPEYPVYSRDMTAPDPGRFESLLEELPESQRDVILMLKVAHMSLEEVARATSSTVGAVKQKAHRAYETIRRIAGREKAHER